MSGSIMQQPPAVRRKSRRSMPPPLYEDDDFNDAMAAPYRPVKKHLHDNGAPHNHRSSDRYGGGNYGGNRDVSGNHAYSGNRNYAGNHDYNGGQIVQQRVEPRVTSTYDGYNPASAKMSAPLILFQYSLRQSSRDTSPEGTVIDIDTSHDDASHDVMSHDDVSHNDSSHDDTSNDDTSHDDTSHDDTSHDVLHDDTSHDDALHDDTSHDDTSHDDALHDDTSHDDESQDGASRNDVTRDDKAGSSESNYASPHGSVASWVTSGKMVVTKKVVRRTLDLVDTPASPKVSSTKSSFIKEMESEDDSPNEAIYAKLMGRRTDKTSSKLELNQDTFVPSNSTTDVDSDDMTSVSESEASTISLETTQDMVIAAEPAKFTRPYGYCSKSPSSDIPVVWETDRENDDSVRKRASTFHRKLSAISTPKAVAQPVDKIQKSEEEAASVEKDSPRKSPEPDNLDKPAMSQLSSSSLSLSDWLGGARNSADDSVRLSSLPDKSTPGIRRSVSLTDRDNKDKVRVLQRRNTTALYDQKPRPTSSEWSGRRRSIESPESATSYSSKSSHASGRYYDDDDYSSDDTYIRQRRYRRYQDDISESDYTYTDGVYSDMYSTARRYYDSDHSSYTSSDHSRRGQRPKFMLYSDTGSDSDTRSWVSGRRRSYRTKSPHRVGSRIIGDSDSVDDSEGSNVYASLRKMRQDSARSSKKEHDRSDSPGYRELHYRDSRYRDSRYSDETLTESDWEPRKHRYRDYDTSYSDTETDTMSASSYTDLGESSPRPGNKRRGFKSTDDHPYSRDPEGMDDSEQGTSPRSSPEVRVGSNDKLTSGQRDKDPISGEAPRKRLSSSFRSLVGLDSDDVTTDNDSIFSDPTKPVVNKSSKESLRRVGPLSDTRHTKSSSHATSDSDSDYQMPVRKAKVKLSPEPSRPAGSSAGHRRSSTETDPDVDYDLADNRGLKRPSTSSGDPRGTSSGGDPRGTSSGGDPRGTSSGGDPRGTSSGGDPRGTSSGGDPRGTSSGGDRRGTSSGGDPRGTSSGGDPRGTSSGRDPRGTSSGGDTRGTSSGGDPRGTGSGGDPRGTSSGGDTRGTSSGGDPRGTSSGGDPRGTSSGGDTRGTSSGGDPRGTSSGGDPRGTSSGGDTRGTHLAMLSETSEAESVNDIMEESPQRTGSPNSPVPQRRGTLSSPVPQRRGTRSSPVPQRRGAPSSLTPQQKGTPCSPVPKRKGTPSSPVPQQKETQSSPVPQQKGTPSSPVPQQKETPSSPVPQRKRTPSSPVPQRKRTPSSPVPQRKGIPSSPVPQQKETPSSPAPQQKGTPSSPVPQRKRTSSSPAPQRKGTSSSPVPQRKGTPSSPAPQRKGTSSSPAPQQKGTPSSPAPQRKGTSSSPVPQWKGTPSSPAPQRKGTSSSPAPQRKGKKGRDVGRLSQKILDVFGESTDDSDTTVTRNKGNCQSETESESDAVRRRSDSETTADLFARDSVPRRRRQAGSPRNDTLTQNSSADESKKQAFGDECSLPSESSDAGSVRMKEPPDISQAQWARETNDNEPSLYPSVKQSEDSGRTKPVPGDSYKTSAESNQTEPMAAEVNKDTNEKVNKSDLHAIARSTQKVMIEYKPDVQNSLFPPDPGWERPKYFDHLFAKEMQEIDDLYNSILSMPEVQPENYPRAPGNTPSRLSSEFPHENSVYSGELLPRFKMVTPPDQPLGVTPVTPWTGHSGGEQPSKLTQMMPVMEAMRTAGIFDLTGVDTPHGTSDDDTDTCGMSPLYQTLLNTGHRPVGPQVSPRPLSSRLQLIHNNCQTGYSETGYSGAGYVPSEQAHATHDGETPTRPGLARQYNYLYSPRVDIRSPVTGQGALLPQRDDVRRSATGQGAHLPQHDDIRRPATGKGALSPHRDEVRRPVRWQGVLSPHHDVRQPATGQGALVPQYDDVRWPATRQGPLLPQCDDVRRPATGQGARLPQRDDVRRLVTGQGALLPQRDDVRHPVTGQGAWLPQHDDVRRPFTEQNALLPQRDATFDICMLPEEGGVSVGLGGDLPNLACVGVPRASALQITVKPDSTAVLQESLHLNPCVVPSPSVNESSLFDAVSDVSHTSSSYLNSISSESLGLDLSFDDDTDSVTRSHMGDIASLVSPATMRQAGCSAYWDPYDTSRLRDYEQLNTFNGCLGDDPSANRIVALEHSTPVSPVSDKQTSSNQMSSKQMPFNQKSYNQMSSNQTSSNITSYNQTSPNQMPFNQKLYKQMPYNQTSFNQKSCNQTSFNQKSCNQTSFNQKSCNQTPFNQKSSNLTSYNQTTFNQTSSNLTSYNQTSYKQMPYNQTSYKQTSYKQTPSSEMSSKQGGVVCATSDVVAQTRPAAVSGCSVERSPMTASTRVSLLGSLDDRSPEAGMSTSNDKVTGRSRQTLDVCPMPPVDYATNSDTDVSSVSTTSQNGWRKIISPPVGGSTFNDAPTAIGVSPSATPPGTYAVVRSIIANFNSNKPLSHNSDQTTWITDNTACCRNYVNRTESNSHYGDEAPHHQQPMSPSLRAVIFPLLKELGDKYVNGHGSHDTVEELQNAFDLVERSSPGITDLLLEEIVTRMAGQTMSERDVESAIDSMKGTNGMY
ncbi:hypothetical protein LSAT2_026272 [Lamellibrachia satsuma]|nr:hypothetical protein LSAT2_026272 [Lamellibrachia satsuma]